MEGYFVRLVMLLSAIHYVLCRNETSREFDSGDEELIRLLSVKAAELGNFVQSGRVFLRKIREWHGAHPAESILAKCVLHHWIEDKIPEMTAVADGYEDGRRGLSTPVSIEHPAPEGEPQSLPNFPGSYAFQDISNRILNDGKSAGKTIPTHSSLRSFNDDEKFEFKRKAVKALYLLYMEVKDLLAEYKLIGCSVHYLISKFWEWVDNAPSYQD